MALAIIAFAPSTADKPAVRAAVKGMGLAGARISQWCVDADAGQACMEATRRAIEAVRKRQSVMVVGTRSAVVPLPMTEAGSQPLDTDAWYEAWVAVLEKHAITFSLIGSAGPEQLAPKSATMHSFRRASVIINKALAASRAYICGRPPYGYRVVEGVLVAQPAQQEAVKLAFRMAEKGSSLRYIVEALQSKHGRSADGSPQFWDRVKLKRIWSHVRLYTQGEYTMSGGQVLRLPSLAFMDEQYEKVPYPSPPVRAAAGMVDVPLRSGKGKMQAYPAPTPRRRS